MAIFRAIQKISGGSDQAIVVHDLDDGDAIVTALVTLGWPGRPYIAARTANQLTVGFGSQAPGEGQFSLDVRVETDAAMGGEGGFGGGDFGAGDFGT